MINANTSITRTLYMHIASGNELIVQVVKVTQLPLCTTPTANEFSMMRHFYFNTFIVYLL